MTEQMKPHPLRGRPVKALVDNRPVVAAQKLARLNKARVAEGKTPFTLTEAIEDERSRGIVSGMLLPPKPSRTVAVAVAVAEAEVKTAVCAQGLEATLYKPANGVFGALFVRIDSYWSAKQTWVQADLWHADC